MAKRLDRILLERFPHVGSRARAQSLIDSGAVRCDGKVALKAGERFDDSVVLYLDMAAAPALDFVSRAGYKLAYALDQWKISVVQRICLDVGQSTGGFTDALLRRGVAHVYGVDVGFDQIHPTLKMHDRVTVYERTDIRSLPALPVLIDFFVIDVSFISVTKIIDALIPLLHAHAQGIVLIKPQFELDPSVVPASGVVTKSALHDRAYAQVVQAFMQHNCVVQQSMESPLLGGSGNREWIAWIVRQ